jgi:hypothetical protein
MMFLRITYPAYPDTACAMRSLDLVKAREEPPFNDIALRRMKLELEMEAAL